MSHYSRKRRRLGRQMVDGPHGYRHVRSQHEIAADDTSSIAGRLNRLGFPDYRSYLRSGHWMALRSAYLARFGAGCQVCGRSPMDIHHRTYRRLGAEPLTDLVGLCRECHQAAHLLADAGRRRTHQRTYQQESRKP
jgi:hypothetical protein